MEEEKQRDCTEKPKTSQASKLGEEIITQRNPEEVSKTMSKSSMKEESINKTKSRAAQN